jgi:ABC-2 type transport system permease protein
MTWATLSSIRSRGACPVRAAKSASLTVSSTSSTCSRRRLAKWSRGWSSSILVGGHGALTGLTGQLIPASSAWRLVSYSWLSTLPPTIAFTGLAVLLSVWSRNAAVGIATPVVLGMVMQLLGAIGGLAALRPYLPTTPYEAWHGFLAAPAFTSPFLTGLITSAVWTVLTLAVAWALLRRRDITGG